MGSNDQQVLGSMVFSHYCFSRCFSLLIQLCDQQVLESMSFSHCCFSVVIFSWVLIGKVRLRSLDFFFFFEGHGHFAK